MNKNLTKENQLFNDMIRFFNSKISKKIFFEEFQKKSFQENINKKPNEIKFFLKESFIKSYNLSLGIIHLSAGAGKYILPDEAKVLLRCLFEHISNYIYIFISNDEKKVIGLIKRFNDYSDVMRFKHLYDYKLNWDKNKINKDEITTEIYNKVKLLIEQYDIINKIDNYKTKYNTSNLNSWHGETSGFFYNKIHKDTPFGSEFLFFKMDYTIMNAFVHCTQMQYLNNEGVFVGNLRLEESLELVSKTLFYLFAYFELFWNEINLNFKDTYNDIFQEFISLRERYFDLGE